MLRKTEATRRRLQIATVAALVLGALTTNTNAINRTETTRTDCGAIRATLIQEGAAILRHTSERGLPIYDRYVSSSLMCESPSVGVWARVPARDTKSCRVIRCDPHAADHNDGLLNFRPMLRITAP